MPARLLSQATAMSDPAIVRAYIANHRDRHRDELDWFARQTTREKAIERAALAVGSDGLRLSHQRRLSGGTIRAAADKLIAAQGLLWAAENFDELIEAVRRLVIGIAGIGPLYVYDTALRIAAFRGDRFAPNRVYLHAGVSRGARGLFKTRAGRVVELDHFPEVYQQLSARELEHLLCSFHKNLEARRRA